MQRFTEVVKRALGQFINDRINDRLKIAIEQEKPVSVEQKEELLPSEKDKVATTEEEIEGYHIVKAVLREFIDPARIVIKDTLRFCGVLLDGKDRKPICRMYLNNPKNKAIGLFDKDKQEEKIQISSINDIYNYSERMKATIKMYEDDKGSEKKEEPVKVNYSENVSGVTKPVAENDKKQETPASV